ncbi:site-specific integrase [Pasteurellaceae bacterium TAE3-ERU1]|nr:site-specific integrase [Pasteurellaceae bacterium TAE3-ERU1]
MATIRKYRGKSYRAEICVNGVRRSKLFPTRQEAQAWAVDTERELKLIAGGKLPDITFREVIQRYMKEVSVNKRGAHHEIIRLNRFLQYPIVDVYLKDLKRKDFEDWRDSRLEEVSSSSVRRELATISHIITTALNKWECIQTNPLKGFEFPEHSKPRTQRYSDEDVQKLLDVSGYTEEKIENTQKCRAAVAMLFAIETAMRAGEITGLTWDNVNLERRIAHLPMTKNGHARDVPLSLKAVSLLKRLHEQKNGELVFQMNARVLDATFRRLKRAAGVEHLHFHDTRREALTRLAKKVDVMTLAKISGHRDVKILLNTYYAPDMENIASSLD